jgi:hypothetical protein
MIAALYVQTNGCYCVLDSVDPWDEARDARLYDGPHPVVAHPPCERWGRYARGGPNPHARRREIGDDGGCFAAALTSVRKWGGVLEHPAASHAWARHGLARPPHAGGWVLADEHGWTCHVEQGHYGHRARKATWLYAVGCTLPALAWGSSAATQRTDMGPRSAEEAREMRRNGPTVERLGKRERAATPAPFRDLLISIAETATRPQ